MDFLTVASSLGPVAGTVIVVLLFTRAFTCYLKDERVLREKLAGDYRRVQEKTTEAMFKTIEIMNRNLELMDEVKTVLIRMNGKR